MKKISSLLIVILIIFSVAACGGDGRKKYDPNKTHIYVGNFNGGLKDQWLNEVIALYEAKNPNISIWVDNDKDMFMSGKLYDTISTNRQDLYFVHSIDYPTFVAGKKLADITDVVNTPLTEFGESKSISQKINSTLNNYYQVDGKYFALPFYDAIYGMVFDIDLFENQKFYISDSTTGDDVKFIKDLSEIKSPGLDGIYGTLDDGLPTNLAQFDKLLQEMRKKSVIPFTWAGVPTSYRQDFLSAAQAAYEGLEDYNLNFTFDGEYTFAGDIEPTVITNKNAYLLQKQDGKKFALDLARLIVSNQNNYSNYAFSPDQSHLIAQDDFLISAEKDKSVAFLLEGGWWEYEATNTFSLMEKRYDSKYGYGKRRFGLMPFPVGDNQKEYKRTLYSTSGAMACFINANSKHMEIAKDFFRFAHTDEAMAIFTKYTGVVRPYSYDAASVYNQLTPYSKQIYDVYMDEKVDIAYNISSNMMRASNYSYFSMWNWQSKISGKMLNDPFKDFVDYNYSVETYLQGMLEKYSDWDIKLKDWIK